MPSNPRLNRLKADYEKMCTLDQRSAIVQILEMDGTPPYRYVVRLNCKGIFKINSDQTPVYREEHRMIIYLPDDYPKKGPDIQMVTKVWHPNIGYPDQGQGRVCYGDAGDHGWAPSMGLDDVVVRIIQMIRYENMNPNSALNTYAALWADKHRRLFPLDASPILEPELDINIFDDSGDLDIRIF
jgi:ubiquitin-protein ligase